MDSTKAELDEYKHAIRQQLVEIGKLRDEVKRLTSDADAHQTLRNIYNNPASSEGNRIKAASAALPVEKPRLLSVVPSSQPSRAMRWQAYERFRLREEILRETRQLPAPGSNWDAHLKDGVYQPPEEGEPPLDVYGRDAIKAHVTLSSLMRDIRRNGNGGGDDTAEG